MHHHVNIKGIRCIYLVTFHNQMYFLLFHTYNLFLFAISLTHTFLLGVEIYGKIITSH